MKLEVGMYVKKKNGRIGRIKEIDERDNVQLWYLLDIKNSNFDVKCEGKHIKKASCCIINLIQVGDYVNGLRIIRTNDDYVFAISDEGDTIMFGNDKQIKSIVTKEQFESMSYKVGE